MFLFACSLCREPDLTGIHAYLGCMLSSAESSSMDLALAQIAALGATVAIVVGMDPHGVGSYWI